MASNSKQIYETHAAQRKREVITVGEDISVKMSHSKLTILTESVQMDLTLKRMEDVLKVLESMKEQQEAGHEKLSALTAKVELVDKKLAALEEQSKLKVVESKLFKCCLTDEPNRKCNTAETSDCNMGSVQPSTQQLANSSRLSQASSSSATDNTIWADDCESLFSTISRFSITIAIHHTSSQIMNVSTGASSHNGNNILNNSPFPLATLEFYILALPCSTLDLFVEYMIGQANACEAQMQGQELQRHSETNFFEAQYGRLSITLLKFNNYDQTALHNTGDELWVRKHVLPTILRPADPNASLLYRAWYERNIMNGRSDGRVFNIEAIFECDGDLADGE